MENAFKKMYAFMGIVGELLGITGLVMAINNKIYEDIVFLVLLGILFVLLILVRIMFMLKKNGPFKSLNEINKQIAKGHLSMMFGLPTIITAFMFINVSSFATTLAIVLIAVVFMSVMLLFMIRTFSKLMDMTQESEKK